jgi:hypothetical protein
MWDFALIDVGARGPVVIVLMPNDTVNSKE